MKKYKSLIVISLILCVAVAGASFLVYSTKSNATQTTTKKEQETLPAAMALLGQKLPEFTLINESEQKIPSTDLGQKPLFIMEWASWCPHCQETLPIVEKLYNKYGTDVEFILVNATDKERETKESALKYLEEKEYTLPTYFDVGLNVAATLQIESVPTMFFVDKDGVVKNVETSDLNRKELEKNFKLILEN